MFSKAAVTVGHFFQHAPPSATWQVFTFYYSFNYSGIIGTGLARLKGLGPGPGLDVVRRGLTFYAYAKSKGARVRSLI